jgi:hypothetical protein
MERRRTLCQLAISNNYFVAKLDDEVVVITGDSSGIREATAETLAEEGAMIAVAQREERNGSPTRSRG